MQLPEKLTTRRLPIALATWVAWVLLTLFGMRWASDGRPKPLLDGLTHSVSWNLVMAVALLALVTWRMQWRDLRFVAPQPLSSLRLLWFPALYLVFFGLLAGQFGVPAWDVMVFVAMNTALVGLSEEWMFRGVLFQTLRSRLALWPAVLMTSALFGSVHVLNVFVTGELFEAAIQALAAFMSGLLFMALLLRTGSLWVPVVYHALWDFGTFMVSASGASKGGAHTDLTHGWAWTLPLILVLPNFLYAMYLLRNMRNAMHQLNGPNIP
jgi:membrane protease YdiL (CAAX protease family)